MKHIFYLHSNICVIAAYDTIERCVNEGNRVVVISNRNTAFSFFRGKIEFHDIQPITDKYRGNKKNPIAKLLDYKYNFLPHFDESAKAIINDEDFMLYTPSYNLFIVKPYLTSRHMKGYYFLEEGTMSYMSYDSLKEKYYKRRYLKGRLISGLFGVGESLDFKVTSLFRGCICLSPLAFPWCNEQKIVNSTGGYMEAMNSCPLSFDHFIVSDYLRDPIEMVLKGMRLILGNIQKANPDASVAIKFHPTAFSYEKEKIEAIKSVIAMDFNSLDIAFLPAQYSVESTLFESKTNLYSYFALSSLSLYSLLFGSRSFYVDTIGEYQIREIPTVEDFFCLTYKK